MGCFVPYFITILLSLIPGVPGVLSEKLDEGMKVQHCALSLVGEPIMYPEINKFVRMLHEKGAYSRKKSSLQRNVRGLGILLFMIVPLTLMTKQCIRVFFFLQEYQAFW